jgi:hypothetical protein
MSRAAPGVLRRQSQRHDHARRLGPTVAASRGTLVAQWRELPEAALLAELRARLDLALALYVGAGEADESVAEQEEPA